jgi:hypothetical protein
VIPEEQIEQAVEWLRANARKAAQARAERIYVEQYRKTVKAQLMSEKIADPIGAQERHAYAHPTYIQHLDAMKEAIQRDEEMQWLRAAAEAKIEAWRSQQANARAEGRATA